MKRFHVLLAVASLAASYTWAAVENTVAGTVSEVEGKVTATDAGGQVRQLKAESSVFLNDKILTGAGAKVEILLTDSSEISQGENGEMDINEYVFEDNARQEASCTLKCMKGLFRVLTGRIVQMNPERFQVQTRMATIGIRGCELGFLVGEEDEDVYVFDLPEGHSIEVEQTAGGTDAARRLVIRKIGTTVSLKRRMAMRERTFTAEEKEQFFKRTLLRRVLQKREAMRRNIEKPAEAAKPGAKPKPLHRPKANK